MTKADGGVGTFDGRWGKGLRGLVGGNFGVLGSWMVDPSRSVAGQAATEGF